MDKESDTLFVWFFSVPVKITQFQVATEVFTNTSFEAVCSAGYPKPMVTVRTAIDIVVENVTKTNSSGIITVCHNITLRTQSYGDFNDI